MQPGDDTRAMKKSEQTEATTAKLRAVGRALFAERGFAGVPAEEIVRAAGVTRGALYHHFNGKNGLFEAITIDALNEIQALIMTAVRRHEDAWVGFVAGCMAFLEAISRPGLQRIVVVEAPAVLGIERRRSLDDALSDWFLRDSVEELIDEGLMISHSAGAVTNLLTGAMNEAALWIAGQPDRTQALIQSKDALHSILAGLRDDA